MHHNEVEYLRLQTFEMRIQTLEKRIQPFEMKIPTFNAVVNLQTLILVQISCIALHSKCKMC